MSTPLRIPHGAIVEGDLRYTGSLLPALPRASLEQDNLAEYPIPWTAWRVWDALATNLPGTSATDDLGLIGGTFATASPSIQTSDLKAAGATTRYARCQVALPPEYVAGQTVTIRFHAGMVTTIADNSATIDLQAYKSDDEAGISSDLVTTSATTINNLTLADKDFAITATSLAPGDVLDLRVAVAVNDASTVTAVIAIIGAASLLCDIKG